MPVSIYVKAHTRLTRLSAHPIVIAIFAIIILFIRKPGAILNPQLWAEDGPVFLRGALFDGTHSLFEPQAGYIVMISRVLAFVAVRVFPLERIPLAFDLSAILAAGLAVLLLATSRVDVPCKPLFALVPVLVPHGGEVFSTLVNIQWFGAPVIASMIVQRPAAKATESLRDILALVLFGLSGPFIVIAVPFLVVRWTIFVRPKGWELMTITTTTVVVCLAVAQMVTTPQNVAKDSLSAIASDLIPMVGAALRNWFGGLVAGQLFEPTIRSAIGGVISVVLIGALYAIRKDCPTLCAVLAILGYGAVLYLSMRLRLDIHAIWAAVARGLGERYIFLPHIMLAWVLLWALFASTRPIRVLCGALVCLGVVNMGASWRSLPYVDFHWIESVAKVGVTPVDVPINPPGWLTPACRYPCVDVPKL